MHYITFCLAVVFVASLLFYFIYGKFTECKFNLIADKFKQQFEYTPFSMTVAKGGGFFFWGYKEPYIMSALFSKLPATNDYISPASLFSVARITVSDDGVQWLETQLYKNKNALGLSTSSITYKWNETGVGDIDGYATHIKRAAKYVKAMRYTGYLGIGFSGLHSLNEIHEACSVGREGECTKKKYTEIGSFALGTGGIARTTLALSGSGGTGISQPSPGRAPRVI